MSLSKIRPTTIALAVVAVLALVVGVTTENAGFQGAGLLFGVVAVLVALRDVRAGGDAGDV